MDFSSPTGEEDCPFDTFDDGPQQPEFGQAAPLEQQAPPPPQQQAQQAPPPPPQEVVQQQLPPAAEVQPVAAAPVAAAPLPFDPDNPFGDAEDDDEFLLDDEQGEASFNLASESASPKNSVVVGHAAAPPQPAAAAPASPTVPLAVPLGTSTTSAAGGQNSARSDGTFSLAESSRETFNLAQDPSQHNSMPPTPNKEGSEESANARTAAFQAATSEPPPPAPQVYEAATPHPVAAQAAAPPAPQVAETPAQPITAAKRQASVVRQAESNPFESIGGGDPFGSPASDDPFGAPQDNGFLSSAPQQDADPFSSMGGAAQEAPAEASPFDTIGNQMPPAQQQQQPQQWPHQQPEQQQQQFVPQAHPPVQQLPAPPAFVPQQQQPFHQEQPGAESQEQSFLAASSGSVDTSPTMRVSDLRGRFEHNQQQPAAQQQPMVPSQPQQAAPPQQQQQQQQQPPQSANPFGDPAPGDDFLGGSASAEQAPAPVPAQQAPFNPQANQFGAPAQQQPQQHSPYPPAAQTPHAQTAQANSFGTAAKPSPYASATGLDYQRPPSNPVATVAALGHHSQQRSRSGSTGPAGSQELNGSQRQDSVPRSEPNPDGSHGYVPSTPAPAAPAPPQFVQQRRTSSPAPQTYGQQQQPRSRSGSTGPVAPPAMPQFTAPQQQQYPPQQRSGSTGPPAPPQQQLQFYGQQPQQQAPVQQQQLPPPGPRSGSTGPPPPATQQFYPTPQRPPTPPARFQPAPQQQAPPQQQHQQPTRSVSPNQFYPPQPQSAFVPSPQSTAFGDSSRATSTTSQQGNMPFMPSPAQSSEYAHSNPQTPHMASGAGFAANRQPSPAAMLPGQQNMGASQPPQYNQLSNSQSGPAPPVDRQQSPPMNQQQSGPSTFAPSPSPQYPHGANDQFQENQQLQQQFMPQQHQQQPSMQFRQPQQTHDQFGAPQQQHDQFGAPQQHPPQQQGINSSFGQQQQQPQPAQSGSAVSARWLLEKRRRAPVALPSVGGRVFFFGGDKPTASIVPMSSVLTGDDIDADGAISTPAGKSYMAQLQKLPGPLSLAMKPEAVSAALDNFTSGSAGPGPSSTPLTALMRHLVTNKFEWNAEGRAALRGILESAGGGSNATSQQVLSSQHSLPPVDEAAGAAQVQQLLLAGKHTEAVAVALEHRLHAFALVISAVCPTDAQQKATIQTLIKDTMAADSPLARIFCEYNRVPTAELPQPDVSQWHLHVQMLLANYQENTDESFIAWGDRLAEAKMLPEAHVCYLLTTLSTHGQRNANVGELIKKRLVLLGGQYKRELCRSALISPETILLTEALEYSRQREQEKYIRPSLLPFRVLLGMLLVEVGENAKAQQYFDHVAKLLPFNAADKKKGDEFTRTLAQLNDSQRESLKAYVQLSQKGAGAAGGGWWPFGRSKTPNTTGRPPAAPATSAAGARAESSSRAAPPKAAAAAPPTQPARASSEPNPGAASSAPAPSAEATPKRDSLKKGDEKEGSGGWTSWFRGSSKKAPKQDDPKDITANVDAAGEVPEYDPVTGRYKFPKSEEEQAVEDQIKAGPPKMPTMSPGTASPAMPSPHGPSGFPGPSTPAGTGAPPYGGGPPAGPAAAPPGGPQFYGTPGGGPGGPPPPPNMGRAHSAQPKYVDMFNS